MPQSKDPNTEVLEFIEDRATPFWMRHVAEQALSKDCVDVANGFTVLAQMFNRRCTALIGPGGWKD
jgi:hypothetical protein